MLFAVHPLPIAELFMAIKEIDPQKAYHTLQNDVGCVYIDVRTVSEFTRGHPDGAVNIPVAFYDPARGMVLNQEFISVVEAHFPRDRKLIVGCQAGPRSSAAAKMLEQAGYRDISNMLGGFGGMRDPSGRTVARGWSDLGLPVSQENGDGSSYESLAAKANSAGKG
jgi:rhodanese-related sulfurtransferase